jgi:hypothetical protein
VLQVSLLAGRAQLAVVAEVVDLGGVLLKVSVSSSSNVSKNKNKNKKQKHLLLETYPPFFQVCQRCTVQLVKPRVCVV